MKASRFPARDCWRVFVPPHLSETGKLQAKYFKTKELADIWIRERMRPSQKGVEISGEDLAIFEFAKSKCGSLEKLVNAWSYYETILNVHKEGYLLDALELFIAYCEHENLEKRTIDDRRRDNRKMCEHFGQIQCIDLSAQKLKDYLGAMPPGSTRKSKRKNVSPFIGWLHRSGYLPTNLMLDVPSTDSWGINDEYLESETYQKLLRTCAGLEPFGKEKRPSDQFKRLLAYYVLRGLAGMRRCELIRSDANDPTLKWEDILWDKNLIYVRDEVAKQTPAKDRKRLIPLEPAARAWLELVRQPAGPVVPISQSTLQRLQEELLHGIKVKLPENALRNSYATYGLAFRSLGDVAKAMGDLESTVKRHYVGDLLEEAEGREWFAISPRPELLDDKVIQMRA